MADSRPVFIFDLDDTLYDRAVPLRKAWTRCFGPQPWTDDQWHELFVLFRYHGYERFEESMDGRVTMDEMYLYRMIMTARDFHVPMTEEQALECQKAYAWEQDHLELGSDERKLLDYIKGKGCAMALITNGKTAHQKAKIQALGLGTWIPPEAIIISEEVGVSKPDPAIFHYAEKKLSLDPSLVWYIGDNPSRDIDAAAAVGWKTIWLDRDSETKRGENAAGRIHSSPSGAFDRPVPQHRPEFTVRSVKEMLQAVKKISGLPDPVG